VRGAGLIPVPHSVTGKFQRVGEARPRARFALARLIRVSRSPGEPLLDLRHAVYLLTGSPCHLVTLASLIELLLELRHAVLQD
jgi:hypothetical protein